MDICYSFKTDSQSRNIFREKKNISLCLLFVSLLELVICSNFSKFYDKNNKTRFEKCLFNFKLLKLMRISYITDKLRQKGPFCFFLSQQEQNCSSHSKVRSRERRRKKENDFRIYFSFSSSFHPNGGQRVTPIAHGCQLR